MLRRIVPLMMLFVLLSVPLAVGAQAPIATKILVDKKVSQLPSGALVWRVETFATKAAAEAAAGPTSLVAESGGKVWLVTLGPAGGASSGGAKVAEIGPVTAPATSSYLLRVVELTGPPGSATAVHSHPGGEAYYVLAGTLSARSAAGTTSAAAGHGMVGPAGGTAMQVSNTGAANLHALALFVVDAAQPFSSPATMPSPPSMPSTGGGAGTGMSGAVWGVGLAAGALLAVSLSYRSRRRVRRG